MHAPIRYVYMAPRRGSYGAGPHYRVGIPRRTPHGAVRLAPRREEHTGRLSQHRAPSVRTSRRPAVRGDVADGTGTRWTDAGWGSQALPRSA